MVNFPLPNFKASLPRLALLCVCALAVYAPFAKVPGVSFQSLAQGRHLNYLLFGRWYFNSLFVALAVTILQTGTSALAAYAFARMRWPGRDRVFLLYLAALVVPGALTVIPNFQLMASLHLLDTYTGLIVPSAFGVFGTILLRQFMRAVPAELDEAARLDGASHWYIFRGIVLPLILPGLAALALVTFLGNYQSLFWPLVLLHHARLDTLPVGLMQMDANYGLRTELILAATMMNIVPLILLFAVCRKWLVAAVRRAIEPEREPAA